MVDVLIQWKGMFAERFRLQSNWLKGKCHVRTFEGHTQGQWFRNVFTLMYSTPELQDVVE